MSSPMGSQPDTCCEAPASDVGMVAPADVGAACAAAADMAMSHRQAEASKVQMGM